MSYSRQQDNMHHSNQLNSQQSSKINLNSQAQLNCKIVTRFPPIMRTKNDQASSLKENCLQLMSMTTLNKKLSEEQPLNLMKKTIQPIKKKGDKKKNALSQIKPEILQRYKQYIDFLNLVNLSNNLRIVCTQKLNPYTLYVGKGNNSSLIKHLFKCYRPWWNIQENNYQNPNINMYWFQLRKNQVLDNFKENIKTQADFDNCDIYIEEKSQKAEETKAVQNRKDACKTHHKISFSIRCQSVTKKDIKGTNKLSQKRSSSKTRITSNQKCMPLHLTLGKDLKDQIDIDNDGNKKKRVLANPKMWPILHNYRKIFSHKEMKQLKKLKVIQQNGKIADKISKNKIKFIQNRSNNFKIHNHLANNWNLSNKKALFMNLKNYYDAQKINPFDFIPMTFHVTEFNDKQYKQFQEQYNRRNEQIKEEQKSKKQKHGFKAKKKNAWFVKPGQNTNRGTGIQVLQSLQQIKQIILKQKVDKMGQQRTHIIQEYIMPFLYQKRKFDIRSYICITSINGYQKGYWFQDGYIRTATKEFNMNNLTNKFIHLTNDAVQKHHQDYGKFEPGNKLSFSDFQRYLDTVHNSNTQNGSKLKFYTQAYPQMKKLAADAIKSVFTKIDPNRKQFSFEIFGLDFLIDDNFKVWLIEANTNPCLQLACPLLGRVIPTMLQNAFKLVIDPLFPPPPIQDLVNVSKKIMLPENVIQNNKFELIFDEVEEGKDLRTFMSNSPDIKIYQIEEQQQQYDENGGQVKDKDLIPKM